ncbi:MAG TPA: tetratricopeptide repeat protein [Candidatus Eisenbacteria bacterium]|nr:tetratricopeptide repeat protein [Candidatus Eisenbacteria bacterium]
MSVLISKPMLQPSFNPGDKLGHYLLLEKIGGGGQGVVWRALDEVFQREVALKILPPNLLGDDAARKRFRQEALAVGKLNHPNVATAYDFDNVDGVDFLVTEFVTGIGLNDKLEQGPMAEEGVVALGIQLASGLEAAHREGIIHRDLKPGNLRITQDGRLKILDFGLAVIVDPGTDVASAETVTLNMTLTGTLPYMAPEQFGGISDQRTDLWAAGVVLYETATGKLPFPETQLQPLKDAILNKEPVPPSAINPAISPGLERVILRALQKDPNKRYHTARALHDDLERVSHGLDVTRDPLLQQKRVRVAAALVLAGVLGFATHHFWPKQQASYNRRSVRLLAVLPLDTGSQDAAENALGRGVAEAVSARISQGSNGRTFQLIPPNELHAQGIKTVEAARREFNVDLVLAVGLQHAGDKLRITCSLIDPRTHQQVDARTVTGDMTDLFGMEDNAVAEVFGMLPENVRSQQPTPSDVHAAEPAAYEYYVRGRGYLLDYQRPENIDAAIQQFEQALKASPNYAPAYAGLGEAYWHGYRADRGTAWLDRAKVNCEKALIADPKVADGHTCLGNLYNDTGKYENAVAEFQRAFSSDPRSVDALNGLAEAYDRMGNPAAAEATYKQAINLQPQYWAVYNWLGTFYYGQARYEDATAMFRKVTEMMPDNHRGYDNLGAMYLLEGKYDDANKALNRAIDLRPTMTAYSNLGESYYFSHRFPEAAAMCEKARALDDKDYLNWGNLADAMYWTPGRRPESFAAYQKAIELARALLQVNPKDATALAYVADYSAMTGDKRSALNSLQKALQLSPHDPDIMYRAALVHNQLGNQAQTLDWLKKAVNARFSRTMVRDTPDFNHLQADPTFKAIISGT